MKRFLTIGFMCVVAVIVATSCTWIDPKINIDPNNPADINPRNGLAGIEVAAGYTHGGDLYRYSSMFTQYHVGFDRQHLAIYQYSFTESDVSTMWQNFYSGYMMELNIMINKTTELQAPHYRGVAKVLMAMSLGNLSSVIGDIPYTEAFKGGANFTPKYDTQEQIYARVQTLLDEAIVDLNATTSALSPGAEDLIFGGDRAKWRRAAWSLKARYAMHLSKRNSAQAATQVLQFLASGMQSSTDDMQLFFGATDDQANPLYQFDRQRNDFRVHRNFITLLNTLGDPRRPFLTQNRNNDTSQVGQLYGSPNSPVVFMSYAESKFLEAEANLMQNRQEQAKTAFTAAVRGSITSVASIAGTLNLAGAAIPAATIDAHLAKPTVVPTGDLTMARLFEQKYIALYPQLEAWSDWRRRGLPALAPVIGNNVPRRYPYPAIERDFNNANWASAGGSSLMEYIYTRVWWDVQ